VPYPHPVAYLKVGGPEYMFKKLTYSAVYWSAMRGGRKYVDWNGNELAEDVNLVTIDERAIPSRAHGPRVR